MVAHALVRHAAADHAGDRALRGASSHPDLPLEFSLDLCAHCRRAGLLVDNPGLGRLPEHADLRPLRRGRGGVRHHYAARRIGLPSGFDAGTVEAAMAELTAMSARDVPADVV